MRSEPISPYEYNSGFEPANRIDELILARLTDKGIEPAFLCSDEVFVRRAYVDVIGTLPTREEARAFLEDGSETKRSDLIEQLMERDEFVDYWTLKWCDILRVKAEFPINLWPNAVQAYHRWIHNALRENMPYDRFARELLTSSGSNFRVPAVNFYRAIQGKDPSAIAGAAALTFMGCRIKDWPEKRRSNLEAFFTRVAYKETAEWKEEIIQLDPAPAGPIKTQFPDGRKVVIEPQQDPRTVFADWLLRSGNPWFARNVVNRQWSWLLGRGIIHEPDDIRPDNPAAHPEVLAFLEKELVSSGYDLCHIFKLILNSRTYQQSSIPRTDHPEAESLFALYLVRRLDAEVLIDVLHQIYGGQESYSSLIPEPFTFVPEEHRTIALSDGSITSQFLEMFGRPARDTGMELERDNCPTKSQRLHMLNSSHVRRMIDNSPLLSALTRSGKGDWGKLLRTLYLTLLSRYPTHDEEMTGRQHLADGGRFHPRLVDLAWALTNTKEFLYRH